MTGVSALARKAVFYFAMGVVATCLMLFLPAGTLDYWQAWLFMAVIFTPVVFVGVYFMKTNPDFLERRLKFKEKEPEQKKIINFSTWFFLAAILIPGLDRRFGWSSVPSELVVIADAVFLLGYILTIIVFKENPYAGRTVEVVKGQKLVSTGLYSIVRHPMYAAQLLIYTAVPIALGSYVALPFFLVMPVVLVFRLKNEEQVLLAGLPGYKAYCKKTRYRMIPGVW